MNNISDAFRNKKAFITYLMAGDPSLEKSAEYILTAQEAGASLIEIGIPFSDPIAEGKVIQDASVRALSVGVRLDKIFEMVASIKDYMTVPMVFMTYINPVFVYGYNRFFECCSNIGICGIIIPDIPFEEQGEVKAAANKYGVEVVTLVAPTSNERITEITENAEGFIYLVSSMGVTGVRNNITTNISSIVKEVRKSTNLPVAVGFGISTKEQVEHYSKDADGVIVGSAIVNIIAKYGNDAKIPLYNYIKEMSGSVSL